MESATLVVSPTPLRASQVSDGGALSLRKSDERGCVYLVWGDVGLTPVENADLRVKVTKIPLTYSQSDYPNRYVPGGDAVTVKFDVGVDYASLPRRLAKKFLVAALERPEGTVELKSGGEAGDTRLFPIDITVLLSKHQALLRFMMSLRCALDILREGGFTPDVQIDGVSTGL